MQIKKRLDSEPVNLYNGFRFTEPLIEGEDTVLPTNRKRFTVTITPEQDNKLEALKQGLFYRWSQSEVMRYVIGLGLEVAQTNAESKNKKI